MKLAHEPVHTPEVYAFIDSVLKSTSLDRIGSVTQTQYDRVWRAWLTSSSNNIVTGLDSMPYSAFSAGTTPAFAEFIARHHQRRVRVSRNDFALTRILCKGSSRAWMPLEDDTLSSDDCVIVSHPFSGNGTFYPEWYSLLDQADRLGVPVFLDAAYFGIGRDVRYELDRACITDFVVSLTKNLTGNSLRLGVRFTREQQDDGITAAAIGSDIFDRLGSYIAIRLLEQFPHDWFVKHYQDLNRVICNRNGLTPTNVLTLALGTPDMIEFQRGDFVRVCISEELSAQGLDLAHNTK